MSIIIRTFCYFILQITMLLSVLLLLRGHNSPGGGFIGALIASTGIGFYIIALDKCPALIYKQSLYLLGAGFICLLASILSPLFIDQSMLTGLWLNLDLFGSRVKLGTPLLFDVGIYLSILGSLIWVLSAVEGDADD